MPNDSKEPDETEVKPDALQDSTTDEAVDDIVAKEGDVVLAVEDAATKARTPKPAKTGWKAKLQKVVKSKWTYVGLVVVLAAIFALPFTRYPILGLLIKKPVSVVISDSATHTPISGAVVTLGGKSAKTDAAGKVKLSAKVGSGTLQVTKQYYKTTSQAYFVGLKSNKSAAVTLVATGRQVPIVVLSKITQKPLANAVITVLDTTAKTDKNGKAIITLPTKASKYDASLTLSGYNKNSGTVQVTGSAVAANTFYLTPSGQIYFLSNLSGTLDVVKTNLDGTGRKTVLAGTGKEDVNNTSLLASRDWKYLVLKAQRDTAQPSLYIIDTSTDKVTQFDTGNADFNLIGWYNHQFLYDTVRNSLQAYQPAREAIKSYNAENGQLNLLDQNQADGDASNYSYQAFSDFYILNNQVVYFTQWNRGGAYTADLSSKTDSIRGVQPSGAGKKDYQTFAADSVGYASATAYEPQGVYFGIYTNADNKTTFYEYENQAVTPKPDVTQSQFNQAYATYLLSPSGQLTFWTELRDGKNTLFTGGPNADGQKQIAALSDYSPYGWYSDDYLLVSKASSELYVMPVTGLSTGQQPLKITDYYKPAQSYNGYGYGYGGL